MNQMTFDGYIDGVKASDEGKGVRPAESWYKGRVLSHSSVQLYRGCPQRWKFRYVDKVPEKPRSYFSFGKSVHAGLEFLLATLPDKLPTLDELVTFHKANWIREGYDTPQQEKWFYNEGERILRGFYAKHQNDFKNVFKIEYKFTFDMDGVPLTGFIDRIDLTSKGGMNLIDYKTGKAFDKARVRSDPQVSLYQIVAEKIFGKPVESVTLYHLNSLTPLTVPAHSATLLKNVREAVVEAAKGINDSRFDPKPEPNGHCQWCDYLQICPAFADKKLSTTQMQAKEDSASKLADRYGQVDLKLKELTVERDSLGQSLLTHMRETKSEEVKGDRFAVELLPDAEEGAPQIEVHEVEED